MDGNIGCHPFNYPSAKPTNMGIVIIARIVDTDTMVAESSVSPPNFSANIVVAAATGEDAAITQAVTIGPVIPKSRRPRSKIIGDTICLNSRVTKGAMPFILKLALARWKPTIIIGIGVFSAPRCFIGSPITDGSVIEKRKNNTPTKELVTPGFIRIFLREIFFKSPLITTTP